MELYSKTNLPKKGWIQGCMKCEIPTSRIREYKQGKNIFKIYFCKDCDWSKKFIKYMDSKINIK